MKYDNANKNIVLKVRPDILVCLFLVIATLAVYWQVRNHKFINFDDNLYVTENHYVKSGLTLENIIWSFTAVHAGNWHPLTWLSHMMDCQLYGMNPGRHHLTNVLIHIVNTLLLFLVFRRMTGGLWQSSFVAALFALHPLHVESVAWVAERKDVLSTFFWMLAMWSYVRFVERSELNRYLLVLLFFILGLMAKPMLVTLPFVLLLLDYWPLNRFRFVQSGDGGSSQQRRFALGLIREKIPLFFLSAASSVATYLVQQNSGAVNPLDLVPFDDRIANATLSYVSYLGKTIWPHNLAIFYPYPEAILLLRAAGAGLILVCVSVVIFCSIRLRPYFTVGWLWYIGTLVPVIGLVKVGSQAMADRYTYIPLIGIFIIIAWGVPDFVSKWGYRKIGLAAITAVTLSTIMIATWLQVGYWSNSITLFEHALDVTADNYIVHNKLGEALAEQDKSAEAIRHYAEASRIKPNFVATYLNLGVALRSEGKLDEAINHFSKALCLKPDCAEAYYELGNTLEKQGSFNEAVRHYSEALRIKPDYAKAHNNLGIVLACQGKDKEAIFHIHEALRIDSGYAGAYYNLGKISANQGRIEDAIFHYRKTLDLNPEMTQALYNLSWITATHKNQKFRNGIKAIELAERLCKITQYNQPLALDALAAAYAEMGRFDDAVLTTKNALRLTLDQGLEELALELKKRLQLYEQGCPYRQSWPEEGNS